MSHSHHNHGDHVHGNTVPPQVTETIHAPELRADDHSGHENTTGSTSHDMMKMFFHTGYDDTILFEQWKPTEIGGMIGSCVFIFFLAFAYEGLKYYREHLYRRSFTAVQYNTVSVPAEGGPVRETQKTVQENVTGGSCFQEPQLVLPVLSCPGAMKQIQDRKESKLNKKNGEAVSVQSIIKSMASCPSCGLETGAGAISVADVRLTHKVKMFSMLHTWQTVLHVVQTIISYFLMLIFMTYNVWLCLAVALGAGVGYFFFGWKKSLVVDITEHCH